MPELPEVEGARRWLAPLISGRHLEGLEVRDEKPWRPSEGLDAGAVAGRVVRALERRAKLLLFRLDGGLALVLHLKIAGQLVFVPPDGRRLIGGHPYPLPDVRLPDASTRFVLRFGSAGELYVNDQRRFAWLRLMPEAEVEGFLEAQRYGPDPLGADFTPDVLAGRLRARRGRPVKAALLDQTCVAGLGNIYANETLHIARIHPMERAGGLDAGAVARLHEAIRGVLEVAVPVGGALVLRGSGKGASAAGNGASGDDAPGDDAAGDGEAEASGHERDFLHAHGKAGEPCPECRAAGRRGADGEPARIVREHLAGRGTYYCPVCQPAPS